MGNSVLKRNILKTLLFFTIIILISFSLFLSILIYHIKFNDVKQILKEKNEIITLSLNNLFIKIKNYVDLLSDDKRIVNITSLSDDVTKDVLLIYRKLQKIDPDILFIYSGYENGTLVINDYVPPKGFVPKARPWYKAALKANPNVSKGTPYREIKTKQWLVSFSKVLKNDNDSITGVLSIDVSFAKIIDLLKKNDMVNCFIVNKNGDIIIHNNINLLNKNYKNNTSLSKKKIVYLQRIKELDWTVIAEVDKKAIFSPIIYLILIINLIIILIVFIIGWGLSVSFTKKIVYPIMKLRERVEAIVNNRRYDKKSFVYPDNEIGIIAKEIEFLTQQEIYKRNIQLQELSQRDSLTNLYNRRYMLKTLNYELERAKRYETVFSLILFDIDYFKRVNDVFGHNAGDRVLRKISELLLNAIRKIDILCRWGGEEFLILCPETKLKNGVILAEKIRMIIGNYDFGIDRKLTISGGVVEYSNENNIIDVIEKVDMKLYQSKNEGRNRISF